MNPPAQADKPFSLARRAKSFGHAGRGLWLFVRTTHNLWLHMTVFAVAVALGVALRITHEEWLAVVVVSGLVFVAEALNSAIETHMDLTSPEYHDLARDTKDLAAAGVFIASCTAVAVGIAVFGLRIFLLFFS